MGLFTKPGPNFMGSERDRDLEIYETVSVLRNGPGPAGLLIQPGPESTNEQNMRREMGEELNTTLNKLWEEILRINSLPYVDKRGNFSIYASRELEHFELRVISQVQQGFDGRTRTNSEHDWNYFGAILYAVTLISTIGYGHITTKTTQGKIATILYSAFGVPLMMLFVANIGSTMARMFRFVFSRIKMVLCCRTSKKKQRLQKVKSMTVNHSVDKLPPYTLRNTNIETTPSTEFDQYQQHSTQPPQQNDLPPNLTTKSSIKRSQDNTLSSVQSTAVTDKSSSKLRFQSLSSSPSISSISSASSDDDEKELDTNVRSLPADIRLNILTGVPITNKQQNSLATSVYSDTSINDGSVGLERKKYAIDRINDLIRQNSVHDNEDNDEVSDGNHQRRRSTGLSPIEFYINETLKLTTNLDDDDDKQKQLNELEQAITHNKTDEVNMQKATFDNNITEEKDSKKLSSTKRKRKELKRSKSESTHNRKLRKNNNDTTDVENCPNSQTRHHRRHKTTTNSNSNDQDITVEKEEIPPVQSGIESLPDSKNDTTSTTAQSFRKRLFSRKRSKKQTNDATRLHRQSSAVEFRQVNEIDGKLNRDLRKNKSFIEKRSPPSYDESNKLSKLDENAIQTQTIPARLTWSQNLQQHQSTLPSQLVYLDDDDDDDDEYDEEMSVPLLVTVFVIPLYLTLGAILFNIWEKEWGFLNSFYFCFITLTTIGFGDYVPGSSLTVAAKEKLISAALYILLGLVLIAMCFNLMKEQLNQKVKRIAGKLGILEC
ncbi:unnamed protein product [Didymodactylos carnosus]|uniref:Potassium channel domain-containing protein n=1 Tax=Didymodactylos carnosus TaxID=1234261 RepID=A0A813ZQF3_9BILA|nr:unnamed protein product [Didymodactylos carnosus]CAF0989554.1 unnamed protein product [Didymodactylos carnosus]CAF3685868.1 unnamed protein product [Didymodactylos carnosus]CAF3759681.1 unnamed protein product [Didymodactylos carnosus]